MAKNDNELGKARLAEYETTKSELSAKASDTARTLAFAEIAFFWMLINHDGYKGNSAIWGFIFLMVFFLSDALHYLSGTIGYIFICYRSRRNLRIGKSTETDIRNTGANFFPKVFFTIKIFAIIASSICLVFSAYDSGIFTKILG